MEVEVATPERGCRGPDKGDVAHLRMIPRASRHRNILSGNRALRYNAPHVRAADKGAPRQTSGQPRRSPREPWPLSSARTRPRHRFVRETDPGPSERLGARRHCDGRPTAVPDSASSCSCPAATSTPTSWAIATLWKRGFVPLLADSDLSRAEISDLVRTLRPAFGLLDRGDRTEATPRIWALTSGPARLDPGTARRVEVHGRARRRGRRVSQDAAVVRLTSGSTAGRAGSSDAEQLLADTRQITGYLGIRPNTRWSPPSRSDTRTASGTS